MKTTIRTFFTALGFAGALAVASAYGAGFFTNGLIGAVPPLTGLETIPADTNLPSGANPASEAVTYAQLIVGSKISAANATSFSATAAQVYGGANITLLLTGAPTTAQTLTLPTAASLIASLPSGTPVGFSWKLLIVNVGGTSSGAWTVAAGTGDTLTGNTAVAVAGSRTYLVTYTGAGAVTFQDYGN